MITIRFNSFSFVREKLKQRNIPYFQEKMELQEGTSPQMLIDSLGLDADAVEFVFVNGKVRAKDLPLSDGDKIALVPPGTPGSYRLILGAKKVGED